MKVVFLGDSGVGKTRLIRKITGKYSEKNTYAPTTELQIHQYITSNGVKYELWDASHESTFDRLIDGYYKNAEIYLIMGNLKDFMRWKKYLMAHRDYNPNGTIYNIGMNDSAEYGVTKLATRCLEKHISLPSTST